jgi:hypothetical protein
MPYRNLNAQCIIDTNAQLCTRINERFPDSGLGRVAAEVLKVSQEASQTARWLARPIWGLRLGVGIIILVLVGVVAGALFSLRSGQVFQTLAELFQGLEAVINDLVFLGIAIFFLVTWEQRIKRKRALKALHVLRSLAHIIDMHQLTKDPERVRGEFVKTDSSPKRALNSFELIRYLDYCSELLAIINKVAALYIQYFDDPVAVSAVSDVQNLISGLSRKIWQKIMILDRIVAPTEIVGVPARD